MVYTTRRRKKWIFLFILGVVVDVQCWLLFSFGVFVILFLHIEHTFGEIRILVCN